MTMGIANVKKPNITLLCLVFLNSFISSSSPAINIIYSKPIVENKSTAEFRSNKFSPCGPMTTPERMRPMIPGIRIRRSSIGDNNIMRSINEKMSTGLLNGVSNAWLK